jgi:RNA polymerase sigma-70 factor (ECF subfamily)
VELATQMNHLDLVEKCKQGDKNSFRKLYDLYAKAMFNTSYRILNDYTEAEDVLQESFMDAYRSLHGFGNRSSFGTWLKQIVIHKSINVLRRKKLLLTDIEQGPYAEMPEEEKMNEEEITLRAQEVKKAIQDLPDGYRTVLSLYLLEGYDHEEISEILQVAQSTVRTQYVRAKQKLLLQLKKGMSHV